MRTKRTRLFGAFTVLGVVAMVGASSAPANAATQDSGGGGAAVAAKPNDFPRQDPAQCTAFTNREDAPKAADTARSVIQLWTAVNDMSAAEKLYAAYLTPGPVSLTRTQVTDPKALADFRDAADTRKAVAGIVDSLRSKLRTLPSTPGTDYSLAQAGLGQNVPISWSDLGTTPGFIAGGLSGVQLPDQTFIPDRRDITGKYSLVRAVTNGRTEVTLNMRDLTLTVRDSIDFCPGNLGSGMIRKVALGMSRLERTPYRDAKNCGAGSHCTYAKPVLFNVTVPLNNVSVDVTDMFSSPEP